MNQTIAAQTGEHLRPFPDGMPSSTRVYTTGAFWEGLWRKSGVIYVALYILGCVIHGYRPGVGTSVDALAVFYGGHRMRILLAAVVFGQNVLNLLWFAAALRFILADAKRDAWGAAVTAASAAFGVLFFLRITVDAVLAYSIGGSGNHLLVSGLNDFGWALAVLSSFPLAMLVMAGSFGLWRAGLVSNALFLAGVAALVLVLLGGTTWLSGGLWSPDGVYSRFVSPTIGLVWFMAVSLILLKRSPAARAGW